MSAAGSLQEGIDLLTQFLARQATRQGVLARRALGQPAPADPAVTLGLIRQMSRDLRTDGSLGGAFVPTVWRLIELVELGADEENPVMQPLTRWILGHQNLPGAYSDGCSKPRHEQRSCEHFLTGFFAPAPPTRRVAPVTLPNGKIFRVEGAARFALSCFALRAVLLAAQHDRPAVQRHVGSLLALRGAWDHWGEYFTPDMMITALHALAFAPDPSRRPVSELAAILASHQGEDGLWPESDLFAALEALLAVRSPEAATAVRRATPALLARLRRDGTFGPLARQERALIGLRALLGAGERVSK
jgi:hypothetical protein